MNDIILYLSEIGRHVQHLPSYGALNGSELAVITSAAGAELGYKITLAEIAALAGVAPAPENAVGDGDQDDTDAWQDALDTGAIIIMGRGKTYKISRRLFIPSGGGIIGNSTSKFYCTTSSGFTNTIVQDASTDDGVVFDLSGLVADPYTTNDGQTVHGVRIEFEYTDGSAVKAIQATNCSNLRVTGNEIWGGSVGSIIELNSLTESGVVDYNYVHDFLYDLDSGSPIRQCTAIRLDGGRYQIDGVSQNSDCGIEIAHNRISSLRFGTTGLAAHNNIEQTDGINTQIGAKGVRIHSNHIDRVGEAIDNFADRAVISGNVIEAATMAGIKIAHGAQYCDVGGNSIDGFGIAGVLFAGATEQATTKNRVYGNIIKRGDIYSRYSGNGENNACILVGFSSTFNATDNDFSGNTCEPVDANYAISFGGSSPWNNRSIGDTVYAGRDGTLFIHGGSESVIIPANDVTGYATLGSTETTFTPVITAATPPTGAIFDIQEGTSVRVGRHVFSRARVSMTDKGSGGSGQVKLTGLPTSCPDFVPCMNVRVNGLTADPPVSVLISGTTAVFEQGGDGVALDWADIGAGTIIFVLNLQYYAA